MLNNVFIIIGCNWLCLRKQNKKEKKTWGENNRLYRLKIFKEIKINALESLWTQLDHEGPLCEFRFLSEEIDLEISDYEMIHQLCFSSQNVDYGELVI